MCCPLRPRMDALYGKHKPRCVVRVSLLLSLGIRLCVVRPSATLSSLQHNVLRRRLIVAKVAAAGMDQVRPPVGFCSSMRLLRLGTPQTGRLLNGHLGPVTAFYPAWVSATLKFRGMVGLSRHPPLSQFLILPSGQTLTHSSSHLFCPNQEPI